MFTLQAYDAYVHAICSKSNRDDMDIQLGNVSRLIQLAIAPALLLVGIGTQVRVLANRLDRIVNRQRVLEQGRAPLQPDQRDAELDILYRRMHLAHRAITLAAVSALLICIVIAALFTADVLDLAVDHAIAALFCISMATLIASFFYFLREIFLATSTLAIWLPKASGKGTAHSARARR